MKYARVFLDRLKLRPTETHFKIVCPFHLDSDPSMSIDLDRGVFYCHGGCPEPKGGGPVEFVRRWAKIKLGRDMSYDEARGEVHAAVRKLEWQHYLRERKFDEIALFADDIVRTGLFVEGARHHEQLIARVNQRCQGLPEEERHDWVWDALDALHHEVRWFDEAHAICVDTRPRNEVTPALIRVYNEAKRRKLWNHGEAQTRALLRAQDRASRKKAEEEACRDAVQRIPRTPVTLDSPTRVPRTPVRLSDLT